MRIEGLPQPLRVEQANQRNEAARQKKTGGRTGDVVELSASAQEVSDLSARLKTAAEEGVNPQLEEVRTRVKSGFYNSPEVRKQIADALLGSGGIQEVVGDIAQMRALGQRLEQVPEIREERVGQARRRVDSGFFDSEGVRRDTAGRILDQFI